LKTFRYILFLLAAVLYGCTNVPEREVNVQACAAMPDGGRASACACECDGKAYVFGGRNGKTFLNDLWEYDPVTDSWKDLGKSPMKARVNATMSAHDGKIYVGLGYSTTRAYIPEGFQKDWWEYTPQTGTWKQLADYPNTYTNACTSFNLGDKIYALYGFWHGFSQYVCCYDIPSDSWTVWPDNHSRAFSHTGGRGALLDGIFYYGGGFNTTNMTHWFAIEITNDQWTPRSSIPGKGREFGACAASNEYIYYFGGKYFGGDMTGGEIFDTYLRFAPATNQWEFCGKMPIGRRENLVAFSIDGKPYFGLGENEKGVITNQLYCVEE